MLDEMHKQKIDMSDEIYVINVGDILEKVQKMQSSMQEQKEKRYLI